MRRLHFSYLRLLLTGVGTILVAIGLAPASASSANISHSYHAVSAITNGSIVSLDPHKSDYIQLANVDNGSQLLGIAVASNDSLVAVDPTSGEVQVANNGNANTLVSNINGDIHVGDQIAVSPFNGVGMKAMPGSRVIGLAQTDLTGTSQGIKTQQVTDKSGKTSSLKLGYVRVSIAVGTDTVPGEAKLNGLQKLAQSLTGHTVSTVRVALSLIVASVAILALVVLIYASIYGSIISIGRNPLARYAVFRTLGAVLSMAILTTIVASITIFLLLR